ncbi:MAG: serine/threonine protein kinase, partial [Polyangiaceae bacterium]
MPPDGAACGAGTAAIGAVAGKTGEGAAPPDIGATPTMVPFSLLGTADCAPAALGTDGAPAPVAGPAAAGGAAAGAAGAGAG